MARYEADDDLIQRLAEEYARAVAADRRQSVLTACKVAWEGVQGVPSGADVARRRAQLAEATSRALARIRYPHDANAQETALRVSANRPGGASVSATAIAQRAAAYADVLAAGVQPTLETVSAAFVLSSIGGSRGPRDELQLRVREGEDFVTVARELATELTEANRRRRVAEAAGLRSRPWTQGFQRLVDLFEQLNDVELRELRDAAGTFAHEIEVELARRTGSNTPPPG